MELNDSLFTLGSKPPALGQPLIVRVDAEHSHKLLEHLLRLSDEDRYLRFGHPASDEQVRNYALNIDLDFDDVFAVLDADLQVVAAAHVAYSKRPDVTHAEFGVSVDREQRGRGLGLALMQRALVHARTREVQRFYIHALAENRPMLNLARKVGMTIESHGSEVSGYLQLPPDDLINRITDTLLKGGSAAELAVRKRARWLRKLT
jgi:RimJ/RimL family protein N-acetyltransferase